MIDVAVLGGGPAGLATAITLARRGRSVIVLERSGYTRLRAGESLGGEVRPLLAALRVLEDFEALATEPFVGVCAAWGSSALTDRSSIIHPFGDGWHVDRPRFDALLATHAERNGSRIMLRSGRAIVQGEAGNWQIESNSGTHYARYLVDASGRGAPATRHSPIERRWLAHDRLVGITRRFLVKPTPDPELLLEAAPDGWWYAAPQPDGALLVTLMTDRDLPRPSGRAGLEAWWEEALGRTTHVDVRIREAERDGPLTLFCAESGRMVPDRGPGWRAVGDAALSSDPLAGNGVARALQAGIRAGEEIDREFSGTKVEQEPVASDAAFNTYLAQRERYYRVEQRWPDALYWRRRHPVVWESARITLSPTAMLCFDGGSISREVLADVEALLPPEAISSLLTELHDGLPAHRAMSLLREFTRLPDQRLLTGLQMMVAVALVRTRDQTGSAL